MKTMYVFVDESGNFDFSDSGTRHFVLTAAFTTMPSNVGSKILQLKYQLLGAGFDLPFFHASENKQVVRDSLFSLLGREIELSAHSFWVRKDRLELTKKNSQQMYFEVGVCLAEKIVDVASESQDVDCLVLLFDKVLNPKDESKFRGGIKPILRKTNIPTKIYFHRVMTEPLSQVADYVAWANYVCLERLEHRPLASLSEKLIGSAEVQSMYLK